MKSKDYKSTVKRVASAFLAAVTCLTLVLSLSSCKREGLSWLDGATMYTDVSYGFGERHLVDLCVPDDTDGITGLILFIHGGSWVSGSKDGFDGQMRTMAKNGYITATLNYSYASATTHCDDILDDIEDCLGVLKERLAEKDVFVESVILAGFSAGGHLALQYSYTRAESSPLRPVAAFSFSGPTDLCDPGYYVPERYNGLSIGFIFTALTGTLVDFEHIESATPALTEASPITHAEHAVPTVMLHGAQDQVVPFSNATALADRLEELGLPYELIVFENSNHGLDSDPECAEKARELLYEYAERYLR